MKNYRFMKRRLVRWFVSAGISAKEAVETVGMLTGEQLENEYKEMIEAEQGL